MAWFKLWKRNAQSPRISIPEIDGTSDEEIAAAERRLGAALPSAFKEFVRRHDGAAPQENVFDVPGNQSGVRVFVPIAQAANVRAQIEGFPASGIPVAEDGCGNYVWLDPDSGAAFFWDHEIDGPSECIAKDFDEFIAKLRPFDPTTVKLSPGQVKHVWVHPDFKPEFD
ncbi:SMI1/KNR4 family protein [Phenylobacterium sp. 58.2.17]|uniref:SMI1/KNR4 family protein n=1 Tax=Phenylobacterium sp. 58.2.17 TaxID=2969306 RepID=UPI00226438FE|nr:SMI1/KNR4 family protein [Phenylobacterium sp. 58.2.17]MCX7587063.1 SMI1/KNR4 family protein [Phenylobacterium sp. 58.2.17]